MSEEKHPIVPTRDFLFVSGHRALDFVNTRPVLHGEPTELLVDFASVTRWFVAAELLDHQSAGRFLSRWANTSRARALWHQVLIFRERLRGAVVAIESGQPLPRKMLAQINALLSRHPMPMRLVAHHGALKKEHRFKPNQPEDLFAPLANAAADLFATPNPSRLRQCQRCVLHFHDTTKNATRRWCSMQLCGNRAKVAKYAARHRLTPGST
jgi:predicted RNA-binding Zn ribbon-like protein